MRELLYLDTSFLHSFLAQKNDGLTTVTNKESVEESLESLTKKHGFKSGNSASVIGKTGKFSIPAVLHTPEGEFRLQIQPGKYSEEQSYLSELEVGKEIISKQLHDNALTQFINFLKESSLLAEVQEISNDDGYIELESNFELIDFRIFETAFSEDMVNVMLMDFERQVDLKKETVNNNTALSKQQKKVEISKIQTEFDSYKGSLHFEFKTYRETLGLLYKFLPTSTIMRSSNAVAPLKEEYIRETANQLVFKYGHEEFRTKVKILGKVTRQIKLNKNNDAKGLKGSFNEFKGLVDSMLVKELNVINEHDYVINPIAIYFD